MRVIAGKWEGKTLLSPGPRVRPTAEELRDVWLSMLEKQLPGTRILDLFAGSGALGIEALSRGAKFCDFVENHPAALHALKANVAAFHLAGRARIFKRDAIQFVERIDKPAYDIALADPPYGSRKLDRIVDRWLDTPFSDVLAVEHAIDHQLPVKGKRRRVGDSMVTVLVRRRSKRRGASNNDGPT